MKTRTRFRFKQLPQDYKGLCRLLLPRPIHDAVEYDNVAELAGAMTLWQDDFTQDQQDYFDLLCSLLDHYDAENVKWKRVSSLDALNHLMAEHEMKAADLSRVLGASRNLGSMILRGERGLSKANIQKLARDFHVSPELFL